MEFKKGELQFEGLPSSHLPLFISAREEKEEGKDQGVKLKTDVGHMAAVRNQGIETAMGHDDKAVILSRTPTSSNY